MADSFQKQKSEANENQEIQEDSTDRADIQKSDNSISKRDQSKLQPLNTPEFNILSNTKDSESSTCYVTTNEAPSKNRYISILLRHKIWQEY